MKHNCLLLLITLLSLNAMSEPAHDSIEVPASNRQIVKIADYSKIRLNGYDFEYLDANNNWSRPETAAPKSDVGVETNADGTEVHYKRGDILFQIGGNWYKGKAPELLVPNPQNIPLTVFDEYVIHFSNAYRKANGLSVLPVSELFTPVAQEHGLWMATQNKMHHITTRANFNSLVPQGTGIKENIAWNQQTPADVVKTWINSSGHRANLLAKDVFEISAASYRSPNNRIYWVQQFRWK